MNNRLPTLSSPKSTTPDTDLGSNSQPLNADSDSLDAGVARLAAQTAFLQAFAEGLADMERPIEEVLPERPRGEVDFGWRAGLRL